MHLIMRTTAPRAAQRDGERDRVQAELKRMMLEVIGPQRQVLWEEFGVDIDDGLRLLALPALMPSYRPNLDALPEFFISLAADVPWKEPAARAVKVAEVPHPPPPLPACVLHKDEYCIRKNV